MKRSIRERILPFIPLLGLFVHFTGYDVIRNPALKAVWLVVIAGMLLSGLLAAYLKKRKPEKPQLIASGLGISAFVLYHLRILLDIAPAPGISPDAMYLPRIRDFLLLAVFILAIAFLVYVILVEMGKQSEEAQTELGNKKQNLILGSVLNLMILVPVIVLVNYLAIMKNYNFDMSAKGKFSLSEPSRKLLQTLKKDVEINAFYPRPLEASGPDRSLALTMIRPDVEIMLDQIRSASPFIKIRFINADVETDQTADFGQISNGSIIVRALTLQSGSEPYAKQMVSIREKSDLETMERKLVQAILNVSAGEKKIYFTVANGERFSIIFNSLQNEKISKIDEALKFLNYRTVALGMDQGWPGKIPADADAVAVIGPTVPFNEAAKNELIAYLTERNGSVFITVDPKGMETFDWLLARAGLKFNPAVLSQYSDKPGIIVAKNFQNHPVTDSISKKELGLVSAGTGSFSPAGKGTPDWTFRPLVESGFETFTDYNLNGRMDGRDSKTNGLLGVQILPPAEKNEKGEPAGKDSQKKFHLVIYSSTSWLTDQYIFYNANPQLAVGSFTWLNQDQIISDIPEQKEEVRQVTLTEDQKLVVWVVGLFVYPALIFAAGAFYITRRRKNS